MEKVIRKMHIVIAHFNSYWTGISGGVERITCEMANDMANRGHKVTILYRDGREGLPYFPLRKDVETHDVLFRGGEIIISEKLPVPWRVLRELTRVFSQQEAQEINTSYKTKQYGKAIKKWIDELHPDIILSSSIPSTAYVIDGTGTQIPVITMIHSHPDIQFPRLSRRELKAGGKSAAIQILLPSGMKTARKYFPSTDIRVIGNAIKTPDPMPLYKGENSHIIINVGSFNTNKDQKLLISAFKEISPRFPDWKLELWGSTGNAYARQVEEEIHKMNLDDKIKVFGKTHHVWEDVYSRGTIYAIASHEEGFPLSLSEAMMMGIPTVGLAECHGVNDLIRDGETGFLTAPHPKDYAKALGKLMVSADLRLAYGKAGKEVIKDYTTKNIYDQWEKLLKEIAETRESSRTTGF